MKKAVKIVGIVLVCLIAAMAIIPLAFKDKIKETVISEAEKYIDAEFGFDGLGISLFREFPQASVSIKGLWVRGRTTSHRTRWSMWAVPRLPWT